MHRVADMSNPSNLNCIQIQISASNLMPKFTQFCHKMGMIAFNAFFVYHLVYLPKCIANCSKVLDAVIQLRSIGGSIVSCLQSVPSVINYHITTTMDAGINGAKLNAYVRCRQNVASIGCSINLFI